MKRRFVGSRSPSFNEQGSFANMKRRRTLARAGAPTGRTGCRSHAGPVSRRAWAALAAVVVVALLFWAALSHRVYSRTLPVGLIDRMFGEDADEGPFALRRAAQALQRRRVHVDRLRRRPALPRTRRPALRAALMVAAFSALVEVAQKARGAHEGLLSNAFDVACGAFGGWLAVTLARALTAGDPRQPQLRRQATGVSSGLPAANASRFCAASIAMRVRVSIVALPTCGVITTSSRA